MTARILTRPLTGGLLLFALTLLAVGCSGKDKPTSSVTGTVKYNNKPLTVGYVNFISASGSAAQAPLDENGAYKIDGPLDAGEFRVYVSPPVPGQFAPGTKAPTAPPKFNVTPKFQDPASSGVKVTVKPGPNEIPIVLND